MQASPCSPRAEPGADGAVLRRMNEPDQILSAPFAGDSANGAEEWKCIEQQKRERRELAGHYRAPRCARRLRPTARPVATLDMPVAAAGGAWSL